MFERIDKSKQTYNKYTFKMRFFSFENLLIIYFTSRLDQTIKISNMKTMTSLFIILIFLSFSSTSNMANANKAKQLAKAAINKHYPKAKDVIIELNEWDYDDYRERYRIKFDATFRKADFLGLVEEKKKTDLYLKCDENGHNAVYGESGFWGTSEVKWTSVYD